MMKETSVKVVYIESAEGDWAEYWFEGPGWYFLDETSNYQWGGKTRDEAIVAFLGYVNNL